MCTFVCVRVCSTHCLYPVSATSYDVINAHREPTTSAVLLVDRLRPEGAEPLSFEKWKGAERRDTRYVCFSCRKERHFFNAVYMAFI